MTQDPQPNLPQNDAWKKLNAFELPLETQLQRERLTRGLEVLKEQGNVNEMHEVCQMLVQLLYGQKAAINYLAKEAANNLISDGQF
jgi:pantothenate kinase